jgi:hypothetical protein
VSLEERKRRERAQAIGLFRYQLICPALDEGLSSKQRPHAPSGAVACPATRVIFRSVRIPPGFAASTSTGQGFPTIRWGLRRVLTEGVLLRVPATHDPTNHMDELRQ